MHNEYGRYLEAPVSQNILPAMTEDGVVHGWYLIATTLFSGTETTFQLPDCEVPLKSVTVTNDYTVKQFMAAVWPIGLPYNAFPWASSSLISTDDGYFRWWSMPSSNWALHQGDGMFLTGLKSNMETGNAPGQSIPPVIETPKALSWQASIGAQMFSGNCSFFDFNWVTLFTEAKIGNALRISVVSNPEPLTQGQPAPMLAKVLGIPVAVGGGVRYDTIRVLRNINGLPAQAYEFKFEIFTEEGVKHPVTLNLTVT